MPVAPRTTRLPGFGPRYRTTPAADATRRLPRRRGPGRGADGLGDHAQDGVDREGPGDAVDGPRRAPAVDGERHAGCRRPARQDADADARRGRDRPERRAAVVVGEDRRRALARERTAARAVLRHADAVPVAATEERDGRAEDDRARRGGRGRSRCRRGRGGRRRRRGGPEGHARSARPDPRRRPPRGPP